MKNVNIRKLCQKFIKSDDILGDVYFFTALPTHLEDKNPGKIARHKAYTNLLESVGINVVWGKFKRKDSYCRADCKKHFNSYEEKQSDINIAITILSDAYENKFEKAVIITADTDFVSTIELIRNKFPQKQVLLLVPPNRNKHASELRNCVTKHLQINADDLKACLF